MNHNRIIRAALAVVLPLSSIVVAAPADQVRDTEVRQEQLRGQTQAVAVQIDAVIADFQRNGLTEGQDIDTLKGIRGVLGQLSEKQMAQVVQLLQQARNTDDPNASRQTITQAVRSQGDVIANLRALLATYRQQQAMYELAARFAQLADRQEQNLGATIEVVTSTSGTKFEELDPASKDSITVQQAQQTGIKEDTSAALQQLKVVVGQGEGKTAQRLAAAARLAHDQNLLATQTAAAADLGTGSLYSAAKQQRTSRDALRDIARLVTVLEDDATRLRAASEEIAKAIEEQKRVQKDTAEAKNNKPKAHEADKQQAKLVDQTNNTRKDLEDLAPKVSDTLKEAEKKMQDTRLDLRNAKTDEASKKQEEAIKALEQAKADVDKQLENLEQAQADPNRDKLAEAKELLEKVQGLKKEQDQLKKETAAAPNKPENQQKQADLQKKTEAAQQEATANNPEAAKPLNEAAKEMDKAAEAMKAQQKDSPAQPQTKASENLAKAEEALKKQVADLEKAKEELAAVEEAQQKVADLIQQERAIEQQTAKAAATQQPSPTLPQSQKDAAAKTESVQEEVTAVAPEAASALSDANRQMKGAAEQLEKKDMTAAREPQREAIADLTKAKDTLDKKAAQLQEQLGLPPNTGAEMAQAQQAIEKAQQETAQAAQQMDQAAQQPQSLQQQQQKLADQAKQTAAEQPQNAEAKKASEAAQNAADELAKGDLEKAAKEMAKAEEAMAKSEKPTPPGEAKPSEQQAELKKATEAMAALQKAMDAAMAEAMKKAGEQMEQTAQDLAKASSENSQALPQSVQQAMEQAMKALMEAAAQAAANQKPSAQQNNQAAQQALSQAMAAMAMAQGMPKPGQPGPPMPGQGKPMQANMPPPPEGAGDDHESGPNENGPGSVAAADGKTAYIGLPQRDRQAIQQSAGAKVPQEYGPMVEQYLRNLANDQGQ